MSAAEPLDAAEHVAAHLGRFIGRRSDLPSIATALDVAGSAPVEQLAAALRAEGVLVVLVDRSPADAVPLLRGVVSAPLSLREAQVLQLVASGLADVDVARRLVVSPRTVHAHLRSVYRKLGVGSRTAAIAAAGLVSTATLR